MYTHCEGTDQIFTPPNLLKTPGTAIYGRIAAILIVACAVCLCTSTLHAQDTEDTTITFVSQDIPQAGSMDIRAKIQRAVFKEFRKTHPNYNIEPFTMPKIEGSSMDTGVLMSIASGNPPHAIYVNFRQSSSYINHGFLEPLEILLARLKSDDPRVREVNEDGEWIADPADEEVAYWLDQIHKRVVEPAWPVVYREADVRKPGIPTGKHAWSLPTSTLVRALLYRKDVFQKAGLDPNNPPETWDELLEYCRQIRTIPNTVGIGFPGGPGIAWGAYSFFASMGIEYMERNEQGDWVAAFNEPGASEAVYFILRLLREPFTIDGQEYLGCAYAPVGSSDLGMRWQQGQIGMYFSYLDQEMMVNINPELVGIAPVPKSPAGIRGSELNCRMMGVFRQTPPKLKLAVMEYLWFITGEQANRIQTRMMVENGYGIFANPDMLRKFGYEDILRKIPPGWQETFQTALEAGVPEPYGRSTQFIYRKVAEPVSAALLEPLLDFPKEEALRRIQVKLDNAAARVDRYLLEDIPEDQIRKQRILGGVAIVCIVLLFGGAVFYVWRAFGIEERSIVDRKPWYRYIKAYVLLLPALTIVLLWQYIPVIMGAPLALFDFELVAQSQFVGIDNFATVLFDGRFWASLARTFQWVLLMIGLGFWPPIFVAILLDEVPTGTLKYIFRTVFYLPTIVSGIIMVFLWRQLYEPTDAGFFNQILMSLNKFGPVGGTIIKLLALGVWLSLIGLLMTISIKLRELSYTMRAVVMIFALALLAVTLWPLVEAYQGPSALEIEAKNLDPLLVSGWNGVKTTLSNLVGQFNIEPKGWIADPGLAMFCCVLPVVWAAAGPGSIIYLAAMKTVPEELVEAASIDGAGILQKICYITLPRIKFLILIQLVGAIVAAFKGGVNFILAMTGGGPSGATRVLGMDIFERTFMELNYGVGAAMAWFLGGLVIALTAYQLKRMSRAEFTRGSA